MNPRDQIDAAIALGKKLRKEKIKKAVSDCFYEHGHCKSFPLEQDIVDALNVDYKLEDDEVAEAEQMWTDAVAEYEKEYEKKVFGEI